MESVTKSFARAYAEHNGYAVAQCLSPVATSANPDVLLQIWKSTNEHAARGDIKHLLKTSLKRVDIDRDEIEGWTDVFLTYWMAVRELIGNEKRESSWTSTYDAWRNLTQSLIRGYNNHEFPAWTIPSLYIVGKYLRLFAIKSDAERSQASSLPASGADLMQDDFDPELEKQAQLRDCEQVLKRIFTLCLNDRAEVSESRKWGIYFVINLLFKTYFKLNAASLSRTILKTLAVYKDRGDMPSLDLFPKSQRVTFKYYEGVLFFLEENYVEAEKHLTEAWDLCHTKNHKNIERILTYLIPCRLLTSHVLPTKALLEPYPQLQELFLPLAKCIRHGDLHGFDKALQKGEETFVSRRIYLTLERGRDIALRNLLRKVFVAGGYEEAKEGDAVAIRRTRVPVAEFQAAIQLASEQSSIDTDEVECLLANMMYKDLMKGYIARERGIVVLSKKGAFPGTGV